MRTTQIIQMTCLDDFVATYIYGPDDRKIYIKPVAAIQEVEDMETAVKIKLKNDLGKMVKRTWLIVIRFHICKLKSQKDFEISSS